MNITLILFLIGILGFVLNRKNIILMLISIEIMLLSITFLILVSSLNIDDIIGQTYAIYIIAIAGAESAIGLGILVAFYRLTNSPDKNPRSNFSYLHFNLLPAVLPAPQPLVLGLRRASNFFPTPWGRFADPGGRFADPLRGASLTPASLLTLFFYKKSMERGAGGVRGALIPGGASLSPRF